MYKINNIKQTLKDVVDAQHEFGIVSKSADFKDVTKQVNMVDYATMGASLVSGFCYSAGSTHLLPLFLSGITLSGDYLHTKDHINDTADVISEDFQKKYKIANKTLEYSRKGAANITMFYVGAVAGHFFNPLVK